MNNNEQVNKLKTDMKKILSILKEYNSDIKELKHDISDLKDSVALDENANNGQVGNKVK